MANKQVTMTLPRDILDSIDPQETDRSRFVAEAVARELDRRRRESLARSLRAPHLETAELAEIGLSDSASRLPMDDAALVDPTAGTPIRSVEGKGWVEEPR